MRAPDRSASRDIVPDQNWQTFQKIGEERFLSLIRIARPRRRRRLYPDRRQGDHHKDGRLAPAAQASRHEENRPLWKKNALDNAQGERDQDAFSLGVRRHVDEPSVHQEVERLGDFAIPGFGMNPRRAGSMRSTARRSRSSPLPASKLPSGKTSGMVRTACALGSSDLLYFR
jgi:hypothetical protein